MIEKNKKIIQSFNNQLLEVLENSSTTYEVAKVDAKNGSSTLVISENSRQQFLHSSYNPESEAQTIAKSINIKEGTPIIFVGVGLGYHLPQIIEKVKPKYFFLLEVSSSIFKETLSFIDLSSPLYKRLYGLYLASNNVEIKQLIIEILQKSPIPPELFILPSYERIFKSQIEDIYKTYEEEVTNLRDQITSEYLFQKLWGLNSVNNFPTILRTPNLFLDIDLTQFKGKPAIIVGAGPSLTQEIENLKKIQEEQSAYIFAVGSAINALIEYNIRPHAVIAYDPKIEGKRAFEKVNRLNITNIPLLFGSTIGTDALFEYPGKKVHFFTSQDLFNTFLHNHDKCADSKIINDAPSVTVIAIEMLSKLECNPILLMGQNLSFVKNVRYAKGIEYKPVKNGENIKVQPRKTYTIESVNNEPLSTSKEYILIKKAIELFLEKNSELNIINCTKNGAKIEHTTYANLEDKMIDFKTNNVSSEPFEYFTNKYNMIKVRQKIKILQQQSNEFENSTKLILKVLRNIETYQKKRDIKKLELCFSKLDSVMQRSMELEYFKVLIHPMTRTYVNKTVKEIQFLNQTKDILTKANEVTPIFEDIVNLWLSIHNQISTGIEKINTE